MIHPSEMDTFESNRLAAIERAACAVADHWRLHRVRRPELVSKTDPAFTRALEALDALLTGNAMRCCCLSKGKRGPHDHAVQCPAYQPSCKADCPCRGSSAKLDDGWPVVGPFAAPVEPRGKRSLADEEGSLPLAHDLAEAAMEDERGTFVELGDAWPEPRRSVAKKPEPRASTTEKKPASKKPAKKGRGTRYVVRGDTYTHKEKLKALGAGWEAVLRAWILVDPEPAAVKKVEALGLALEEI